MLEVHFQQFSLKGILPVQAQISDLSGLHSYAKIRYCIFLRHGMSY